MSKRFAIISAALISAGRAVPTRIMENGIQQMASGCDGPNRRPAMFLTEATLAEFEGAGGAAWIGSLALPVATADATPDSAALWI